VEGYAGLLRGSFRVGEGLAPSRSSTRADVARGGCKGVAYFVTDSRSAPLFAKRERRRRVSDEVIQIGLRGLAEADVV
jgi:hypothetical protein